MTRPGHHPEFDAIYQRLRSAVLSVGYQMTGDAALAEDVLQETFLLVHRHLRGFRGDSDVGTWVYRIAVRVALRMRRERTRRQQEAISHRPSVLTTSDLAEDPLQSEERRRLYAALDRLPDDQRTVISLLAIREIPARQVAAILNIPEGTVWSRAHHARQNLRNILDSQRAIATCS